MFQKRRDRLLAWILMLSALLSGCSAGSADSEKLAALERENEALAAQVLTLSARLEELQSKTLDSWELTASLGETTQSPVRVLFTAVPAAHTSGQEAALEVTLEGGTVETVPCLWDGAAFTAFLTLTPADGYGYYCLLSGSDGETACIALSTPDHPENPVLTDLASSLQVSCELVLEDWYARDGALVLTAGTGTVHLPLLGLDGEPARCASARLVLRKNGSTLASQDLPLVPGETGGSSHVPISQVRFSLPELQPEDQLELCLEVFLTTGGTLSSPAFCWYPTEDGLESAVG